MKWFNTHSYASYILLMLLGTLLFPMGVHGFSFKPVVKIEVRFDPDQGLLTGKEVIHCSGRVQLETTEGTLTISREECRAGYTVDIRQKVDSSRRNIALLDQWIATPNGLAKFDLTVVSPEGWVPVSESDGVDIEELGDGLRSYHFRFPYPRHNVTLVIGRYHVDSIKEGGIELVTYFFEEHRDLSKEYLVKSAEFISDFQKRLGPFPFKRFQVVENEAPTGFGMATMTLIGTHIIAYPFIVEQSLGHEIAHSWFGNSVYVKGGSGNWCEGLTTYVADYHFKEKKGEAVGYRHDILIDYESYVHPQDAISIQEFRFRRNRMEKAVGYGKCAMFFHMLRQKVGDQLFFMGLRKLIEEYSFNDVSFDDIRYVFEAVAQIDLHGFFRQWLQRKDIPEIGISSPVVSRDGKGKYVVSFDLIQKVMPPYDLSVPYVISTSKGDVNGTIETNKEKVHITLKVDHMPDEIALDPDFDLMRHLTRDELPPTISRLFGAYEGYIVGDDAEAIRATLGRFGVELKVLDQGKIDRSTLRDGSFLFVGDLPKSVESMIGGDLFRDSKNSYLIVEENPLNPDRVVAHLHLANNSDAMGLLSKAIHYGRYNYLEYSGGQIVKKEKVEGTSGIIAELKMETMGIASRDLYGLSKIIDGILDKTVVFVGEEHDQYSHHIAQLDVIRGLRERGIDLAVGMEMFQRPFQKALDDFISGKITEREFLKESQYFKRWGYDYVLYRPILRYCRENRIPVIALNLRKEISRKVARHGIESLTPEEKKLIPKELDFSNAAYKARLKEVFEAHEEQELGNFEYFYQAQILWDETMAESVAQYLKTHQERHMVVLAGIGHIGFGYGIPDRVKRRTGKDVVTIASTTDVSDPGLADYFLFPPYLPKPFSARLGVLLDVTPGKPITIKRVMPGSAADLAGLRPGDQILAFDNRPVKTLEDLKIGLLFKKPGDTCLLKIKRNRRFLPDITKSIEVGPFSRHGFGGMHGRFHQK